MADTEAWSVGLEEKGSEGDDQIRRPQAVAEGDRAPEVQPLSLLDLRSAPGSQASKKIESALNGAGDQPTPMNVPADVRQLVVVTADGFNNNRGELRMFERASEHDPWRASELQMKINLGEKGMGWGAGGLINRDALIADGRKQRVGGPALAMADDGKPICDASDNAKCEGDRKTTAGLFRLGLAWGTADAGAWPRNDAPEGTTIPYRRIDADYRLVPTESQSEQIRDQQGRVLNGKVIRELDPEKGTYEQYHDGGFVQGSLSPEMLAKLQANTEDPNTHYRWVHKDVKDRDGKSLSEMLVRLSPLDASQPVLENPGAASWMAAPNGTQLAFNDSAYEGINPQTGEKFNGSLDQKTAKAIFNDSDYRWGDIPDKGHKMTVDENGQTRYSNAADDYLYNHPVRIVDAKTGEYEHLDPASGKLLSRGRLDSSTLKKVINDSEDMNDAYYRYAVNILQNTDQKPGGGSAIFIHQEAYLRRNANQPDDTLGCISMPVEQLRRFIATLDKSKNPAILIAPISELDTVRRALD